MEKTVIKIDIPLICNFRWNTKSSVGYICSVPPNVQCNNNTEFPKLCPHRGGVVIETPFKDIQK